MMGVRDTDRSLEQWQLGIKDLNWRLTFAQTPREREQRPWSGTPTPSGGGPAALIFEQTGGSPRSRRGAKRRVERGGAGVARHGRH